MCGMCYFWPISRPASSNHLRKRRGRWLVQVAVPSDLRGRVVGKSGITLSNVETYLGTDSKTEAQRLAPEKVAATLAMFDNLRRGSAITSEEIAAEAAVERRRMYDYLERDPENGREGLAAYLDTVLDYSRNEIREGNTPLRDRAVRALQRIGAVVTEDAVKAMAESLAFAALDAEAAYRAGVVPPKVASPASRLRSSDTPFLTLTESYLTERSETLSASSKSQFRTTYKLFADHIGDTEFGNVTRPQVTEFLNRLSRLHRHYGRSPGANKLSLSELELKYPAHSGQGLRNKTLNRHLSCLSSLFDWSRDRGYMANSESPFAKQIRKDVKRRWLHFETDELNRLFAGQRFDVAPKRHSFASALPWAMAVALFAGMREGEIADLDAEDIKWRNRVWFFDIMEAKSEAGVRLVPVHSRLEKIGFLEYVRRIKSGPLFPGLPVDKREGRRGHTIAKRFPAYRRQRGVNRDRLVFHSFRKTFVSALREAKVDISHAAEVVGHEDGFTYNVYATKKLGMAALRKVVEAVKYRGLKLAEPKARKKRTR